MNLSGIQAECGRLLGDPNNDKWSQAVLTTRANLAQTEIQGYTNAVRTIESLTPVAGQNYLGLNAAVINILRVTKTLADGVSQRPLPGITTEELEYLYPDWAQWQSGEPLYFSYSATLQQIYLYPTPDASNAITSGLTVHESRTPANLVSSTDTPFDSNNQMIPYHYAIVHWVVAHCFMDDGTPEALAKAKFHRSGTMLNPGEYEKEIGRIIAEFDIPETIPERVLFRPQGGRVGSWSFPSKSNPLPW